MLNPQFIYYLFPIAGAVLGAMLWLKYFLKIDVFEHERIIDIVIAFFIGFLIPDITLFIYRIHSSMLWSFNGLFWNDLFYAIIGVGLTEELSKLIGVTITFLILRKKLDEPIDYLIFAGVVALGFSIRENFIYYINYGSQVITGRTLISSLIHIINTSICVYGMMRYEIFKKGNAFVNTVLGIVIAVVSHGLFDFFLTQSFVGIFTPFLASIIYLIGINFWIQMFNNCINFSPFFQYHQLITTTKLYQTILGWYAGLLLVEFCYVWHYKNIDTAVIDTFKNIFKEGVLLLIVALRASRLRISKLKYFEIKIQSPFYITKNGDEDFNILGFIPLKIRGENKFEFVFLNFIGHEVLISPVNAETTILKTNTKARILDKFFLKEDVVTYTLEFEANEYREKVIYILKPKTMGNTLFQNQFPIAELLIYTKSTENRNDSNPLSLKELEKVGLVFVK